MLRLLDDIFVHRKGGKPLKKLPGLRSAKDGKEREHFFRWDEILLRGKFIFRQTKLKRLKLK